MATAFLGYQEIEGSARMTTSIIVRQYTKAKEESTGIGQFIAAFTAIFITSIFFTIGWATGMIVPVAMIVIGAKYMDECPAEKMIPVTLVVGGVFILVLYLFHMMRKRSEEGETNSVCLCCALLIYLFLAIWLIIGSVFVYRNYKHNFDGIACSRTLYTFSFWLLNGFYIIAGFMFVMTLCAACIYCVTD